MSGIKTTSSKTWPGGPHTLADKRFDLLEKIAAEMAKAREVKLPPKLNVVPSADSPERP